MHYNFKESQLSFTRKSILVRQKWSRASTLKNILPRNVRTGSFEMINTDEKDKIPSILPHRCQKKHGRRELSPVVPVAIFAPRSTGRWGETGNDEEGAQPWHLRLEAWLGGLRLLHPPLFFPPFHHSVLSLCQQKGVSEAPGGDGAAGLHVDV